MTCWLKNVTVKVTSNQLKRSLRTGCRSFPPLFYKIQNERGVQTTRITETEPILFNKVFVWKKKGERESQRVSTVCTEMNDHKELHKFFFFFFFAIISQTTPVLFWFMPSPKFSAKKKIFSRASKDTLPRRINCCTSDKRREEKRGGNEIY